jgi:membrane-associated phospholipid phosphatase
MLLGTLCLLLGVACLPVDVPIARWFRLHQLPDSLHKVCCLGEVFAHGLSVALLILLAWVLDPSVRARVGRLSAMSLGAGLLANVQKLLLARHRPYHFDFQGDVAATFEGWLPWWSGGSGLQSFLSSHAAVAAGLAVGLAWLYPRGRWLWLLFASLAGMQRLIAGAHFSSDVLWGAGLGALWAGACLHPRLCGWGFDHLEGTQPCEQDARGQELAATASVGQVARTKESRAA